jgi:hypothetical protein
MPSPSSAAVTPWQARPSGDSSRNPFRDPKIEERLGHAIDW